jgi:enoyl-CoA hydratase
MNHYHRPMEPVRLTGREFAAVLPAGEAAELLGHDSCRVALVDGDEGPDVLEPESTHALETLPALVVGVVTDPASRMPEWADLVVGPGSSALDATLETVARAPLAAATLAVLMRTGHRRSVPEGLVAESTAYGLLQSGPEFRRWADAQPRREREPEPAPAVVASRHGDRLSITLNRPHVLNAFSATMRDELIAALHVAAVDPTVAAIDLRGAGPSFCSGGDLDEFGSRPDPVTAHLVRLQRNAGSALTDVAARTTAHIHGSTVGSGIELAAFAHRVVARADVRISLPEVRMGLIPGAGGTVSLTRRIGRHATMLLAIGLPSIDADTALAWGLVDQLEP